MNDSPDTHSKQHETTASPNKQNLETKKPKLSRLVKIAIVVVSATLFLLASIVGYVYATSPEAIREPLLEHYHFRMQVIVDGKAENFSNKDYQVAYAKDQCSADLTEQPIHFHDGKDQFVHIHWEGMTGGMVMKYYGWNFIGGQNSTLGYRLDRLPKAQRVLIHGSNLPSIPENASFYVYTGDESGYKKREFNNWKDQDLEVFFNKTSNFPAHDVNKSIRSSLLNTISPRVYAHGTADDEDGDDGNTRPETEQEKLTRINNLIGNVVIFVQKDEPTDKQIKDRFAQLVPLSESTCGG